MQIDLSTLDQSDHAEVLELKSYQTFKQLFEDTTQARILTYYTTHKYLIETTDDVAPEASLAITIGDTTTYRDQLEKSVELTDHLEQLRRDEQVTIWDYPNRNVHDKLYRLAFDDSVSCLIGSANFSKNGWSSQHDDPCRNTPDIQIDHELTAYFDDVQDRYARPFMDDLTAATDDRSDSSTRREVIETWLQTIPRTSESARQSG